MSDETVESGLGDLRDRVGKLETNFETMRKDLATNTASTMQIASDTSDLVEFTRTVSWLAKISKPAGYVATLVAAIAGFWAATKSGVSPK